MNPTVLPPIDWSAIAIAVIGVIGSLGAAWLIRRSKREEDVQDEAATGFAQLTVIADGLRADLARVTAERDSERVGRRADNDYAEGRWSRQMDRCRKVTDAAAATIATLSELVPNRTGEQLARDQLDDLHAHEATDHPERTTGA